jgi:NhaP-type Na+/H+ or K+/H+ antiporter
MKTSVPRLILAAITFLAVIASANAHPGHDGHELTWEIRHLAQHPVATMVCAALVGAAAAIVFQFLRRRGAESDQSLRASQRSRGK